PSRNAGEATVQSALMLAARITLPHFSASSSSRRLHDYLGSDIGAGARPILDDERLAEALGELLADQARDNVSSAAGGITDNDAHRPRRIGLRSRDARHSRQRGSTRGQMQKISSGKFHVNLPLSDATRC